MSRGLLVVGGDSVIGAALVCHWQGKGQAIEWTSRRAPGAGRGLRLDLGEPPDQWPDLSGFEAAVVCAGITQQELCRQDPAATRRVNVEGTIALCRHLAARGSFLVFPSTNLVFDGTHPFCRPDDPVAPRTEYGRQKAEVETGLRAIAGPSAVVRLTKVLHPGVLVLRGWVDALRAGRTVTAFDDCSCAPISLPAVVNLVARIVLERRTGIWQASGTGDVVYAELALLLAAQLGVSSALVNKVNAGGMLTGGEGQGPHTTLDATRTSSELGFQVETPAEVLATCVTAMTGPGA